jgi:hypothetical protein
MLLASSAIQASILVSLSVLLHRADISPAEVLIIVAELGFAFLPATMALLSIDSGGQGLGVTIFVASTLWYDGILTWFWARGYAALPLLDTTNAAFFYTQVSLTGWFRTLNLVMACCLWFPLCGLLWLGGYLVRQSYTFYWEREEERRRRLLGDRAENGEEPKLIEYALAFTPFLAVCSLIFSLPLLIVGAEKMIQWNGLSPNTDLSAPGQVIPFAVGVVGLLDALMGIWRHARRPDDHILRSQRTGRGISDLMG